MLLSFQGMAAGSWVDKYPSLSLRMLRGVDCKPRLQARPCCAVIEKRAATHWAYKRSYKAAASAASQPTFEERIVLPNHSN
jgi:hypothetical protein